MTEQEKLVLSLLKKPIEKRRTYQDIADELGLTRQRIGQIVANLRSKGKV